MMVSITGRAGDVGRVRKHRLQLAQRRQRILVMLFGLLDHRHASPNVADQRADVGYTPAIGTSAGLRAARPQQRLDAGTAPREAQSPSRSYPCPDAEFLCIVAIGAIVGFAIAYSQDTEDLTTAFAE